DRKGGLGEQIRLEVGEGHGHVGHAEVHGYGVSTRGAQVMKDLLPTQPVRTELGAASRFGQEGSRYALAYDVGYAGRGKPRHPAEVASRELALFENRPQDHAAIMQAEERIVAAIQCSRAVRHHLAFSWASRFASAAASGSRRGRRGLFFRRNLCRHYTTGRAA